MISSTEFKALLEIIVPRLVIYVAEHKHISYENALIKVYESKLYESLEDESTKLWHLSIPMLFDLYEKEKN